MPNITYSNPEELFSFLAALSPTSIVLAIGISVLTALIHIVFARAVYREASRLDRRQLLTIGGPKIWCLATLVGGVITAAIYWVMYHSILNPVISAAAKETDISEQNAERETY